jgi:hypothetical protein
MEPTMHFRWLISHRNDYERVLQQLWRDPASTDSDEWRNVPEVIVPMRPNEIWTQPVGTPPAAA